VGKKGSNEADALQYHNYFIFRPGHKTNIGPGDQRNYTTITSGQSFTVPPYITHEFRTKGEPTVVEEIAYVEYDSLLGGDL
jgi:hypothetical protein